MDHRADYLRFLSDAPSFWFTLNKSYDHHLSRALGKADGFNPKDPTIQKTMQALLAEFAELLSTDYELNVIDSANNSVTNV